MDMLESLIPDALRDLGVPADCVRGVLAAVAGLVALKLLAVSARLGSRVARRVFAGNPPGELCREIVAELEHCAASWNGSPVKWYTAGDVVEVGRLSVGRLDMWIGTKKDALVEIRPAGTDPRKDGWNMLTDLTPRERKIVRRAALAAIARAKAREAQAHHEASLRMLTREPETGDRSSEVCDCEQCKRAGAASPDDEAATVAELDATLLRAKAVVDDIERIAASAEAKAKAVVDNANATANEILKARLGPPKVEVPPVNVNDLRRAYGLPPLNSAAATAST